VLTKICNTRTSSNSFANVTKNLIHWMISLNVGVDLGWRCLWYSFLLVIVLPIYPCHCLDVFVPHLELGAAPLLRKKVDLALVVPVVAHRLSP
jgi:hypothetical protein